MPKSINLVTYCTIIISNVLSYITKYLMKTGEKIVYSRGIASEIIKKLKPQDFACQYYDFVAKFVLFDDVLEGQGVA